MLFFLHSTSSDCTGNGTFVSFKKEGCKRFYLITCIHIFLTEDEGKIRKQLKALQRILVARCSAATYVVANRPRNLELTAKEVLLDSENPAICFDQVLTTVEYTTLLSHADIMVGTESGVTSQNFLNTTAYILCTS